MASDPPEVLADWLRQEITAAANGAAFDTPRHHADDLLAALRAAGFAIVADPDGLVGDGPPPVLRHHMDLPSVWVQDGPVPPLTTYRLDPSDDQEATDGT